RRGHQHRRRHQAPAQGDPPAAGRGRREGETSLNMTIQFDPTSLAKYGHLTMIARTLVEGFLTGVHKSPYKGYSVEFAEHRQYYPGDEIRHIDSRVYGKTDRYYIKEYEEETNLRAHLFVDASGSMAYKGKGPSKFE